MCIILHPINLDSARITRAVPKEATASSTLCCGFGPEHAIDGRIAKGKEEHKDKMFHSELEWYPWLMVELASKVNLQSIKIFNRANDLGNRLREIEVRAGTTKLSPGFNGREITSNAVCGTFKGPGVTGGVYNITCSPPIQSNVVTIQLLAFEFLQINEVQFFQTGKLSNEEVIMRRKMRIFLFIFGLFCCKHFETTT